MTRRFAVVWIVAALLLSNGVAFAQDATSQHVADLAHRALTDPSALDELRSIRFVDGRPVDLGRALSVIDPEIRSARLRALAGRGGTSSIDPAEARGRASRILEGRKYNPTEPPRPFRGVLDTLGDWLDRYLTKPVGRVLEWFSGSLLRGWDAFVDWVPGGEVVAWSLLLVVVLTVIGFVTWRLARRRARSIVAVAHGIEMKHIDADPRDLDRQADEAETAGDLVGAIRLRFIAGLLRLDRMGVISFHPALTAGQVKRKLRSSSFDRIVVTFERVVYGHDAPDAAAVENTKAAWKDVLEQVAA